MQKKLGSHFHTSKAGISSYVIQIFQALFTLIQPTIIHSMVIASLHVVISLVSPNNNQICLFHSIQKNDAYKNLYNMLFLGGTASLTRALSTFESPMSVFNVNELTSLCKCALSIKMSVNNFLIVL